MKVKANNKGFSLTEVLMSVGVLAVGMSFIAGVFPVAIHYSTVSTERTIATIVADEAFAKVRLFGQNIDLGSSVWPGVPSQAIDYNRTKDCVDFNDVCRYYLNFYNNVAPWELVYSEFTYPSTSDYDDISQKKYWWWALCRRVSPLIGSRNIQVTVFVNRVRGRNLEYRNPYNPANSTTEFPKPIKVEVLQPSTLQNDELLILDYYTNVDDEVFINDGYTIVDNETGDIYRVVERYADRPTDILLDRKWEGADLSTVAGYVWVIPPPKNGGRSPCIGVFQKVISF